MTSIFFMFPSPSSLNSSNKQRIFWEKLKRRNSNIQNQKAIEALNIADKNKVWPMIERLKDEDQITAQPATMEDLAVDGRLIKGGLVFQQNFVIRSFEVDSHYKVKTRAIMCYLQEAPCNRRKKMGMSSDALIGVTPEMSKRDLIWVYRAMHIEIDSYPSWSDVVQVNHWFYTSGKTGLRFDLIINDCNTCQTLVRASCLAVMMNKKTRRVCSIPEEVKEEIKPYETVDAMPIVEADRNVSSDVEYSSDYIRTGLTPGWHDLDFNNHVSNIKYLDWILEELSSIKMEYRNECLKDDVIQSLSKVVAKDIDDFSMENQEIELHHILRLENGAQVLRAKTTWRPKYNKV